MTTIELLTRLRQLGVRVWAEGDRLRFRGPDGALTPALRAELAEQKAAVLSYLREANARTVKPAPALRAISREQPPPLSFGQQRLWFIYQLAPQTPAYNVAAAVRLEGALDAEALRQSLSEIVRRHEVLRTIFDIVDGRAAQIIMPPAALPVPFRDLSRRDAADGEVELRRVITEEAQTPFDLERGPVLRAHLMRLAEDEHVLLLNVHHIAADGWSLGVLVSEFVSLYEAHTTGSDATLPELPVQYADFAHWQREYLQGETLDKLLAYWKKQLAGSTTALELPFDHPHPATRSFRGGKHPLSLGRPLTEALAAFSQREGLTLFMTLLAALDALLARYSDQTDISVGSPIANRTRPETRPLVGFFVNTLVLRTDLSGNPSFRELARRVREVALEAYAHQDLPFEQLVEMLETGRDLSRTPLFQVVFTLQNNAAASFELQNLHVSLVEIDNSTAKFDLTFNLSETPEGLRGWIEYNSDIFEAPTVARMAGHYRHLLESVTNNPELRLRELSLLTEAEHGQIIGEWGALKARHASELCLHEMFEAQAERTPDAVALVYEGARLTYAELDARANQLAHHLRGLGVGAESLVGLSTARGLNLVVALLGILKAGGAYVPLDPAYPNDRLAFMLGDTGAHVFIGEPELVARLTPDAVAAIRAVCLETDAETISRQPATRPRKAASPDNLAYIIYTSGSTGRPKGVCVTHRNVARLFAATNDSFRFTGEDVWTLFHSGAFDFSVWEIWGALCYGGRLVVVPYIVSRSPESFYRLLAEEKVTVLNQTPSAFRQLIAVDEDLCDDYELSLRFVVFGGEALDFQSLRPWFARHGDERPQLVNMYGITETTVHVTYHPILDRDLTGGRGSRIGQPIPDLQCFILDAGLMPVPIGVAGELYVGGAGLARGYLNRAELTAERFVPNPFTAEAGARLYRTGDAARYDADGRMEYVGRIDSQVKVRGFRIELGEIESVLGQHQDVAEAVLMAREDGQDERRLVAYVVPRRGVAPTVGDLQEFLKLKLPEHMIPAAFVLLDALPLTANGKIDRRALPAPQTARPDLNREFVAPATPVERELAAVWEQALRIERVGVHDGFFELGGDSIRSLQVIVQARQRGLDFTLQDLFRHQTIHELARVARVSGNGNGDGASARHSELSGEFFGLIAPAERARIPAGVEDAYPLGQLQAGMLFHSVYQPDATLYHNTTSLHLQARFDPTQLREALERLFARHPALRTAFALDNFSEPLQLVYGQVDVPLEVVDIRHLTPAQQEEYLDAWFAEEQRHRFDWTRPPLIRFTAHRRTDQTFQFSWTEHHAILDGWSVATMLADLFQQYFGLLGLAPAPPPPPPANAFREFIALERETLASAEAVEFWRRNLGGVELARLPRLKQAGANGGSSEGRQLVPLSAELSAGLRRLATTARVPLKSVLVAAHLRVLALLSNRDEVVTGIVTHGRPEREDTERALGLFLNSLPLKQKLAGGTWLELIEEAFQTERELMSFRRYPLAAIQRTLGGGEPVFETLFNYLNFHVYDALQSIPELRLLGSRSTGQTNLTLAANFWGDGAQLHLQLDFNARQLAPEQAESIARYYSRALTLMAEAPHERYERQDLLGDEERRQLLVEWNGRSEASFSTPASLPSGACLHETFERQARETPDAVAVAGAGEESLTYSELNARANQLAAYLRESGIAPEEPVGVLMDSSVELVVALLGILKAGGCYVPLDPSYPAERLAFVADDARIRLLLTVRKLSGAGFSETARLIEVDAEREMISRQPSENLPGTALPSSAAYLIYTSGSTGTPKGVCVEHGAAVRHLLTAKREYGLTPHDRVLQFASPSFDVSLEQIFAPLFSGARLVMRGASPLSIPDLNAMIRESALTVVNLPPQYWHLWLDHGGVDPEHRLRLVIVGGDALSPETIRRWRETPPLRSVRLLNAYGPTETVITATTWEVLAHFDDAAATYTAAPIGRPLGNRRAYVLNAQMLLAPVGVPGELYLGGEGLARGYLNRPDLTAERFVPDPFSPRPGARLYRTGDLARFLPDGQLEFLGRTDRQVKVRGFRIELGEVEAALLRHEAVREAVVVAGAGEGAAGGAGGAQQTLVAYVVKREDAELQAEELRRCVRERLPEYMTPGVYAELEELPLLPNGKVDRGRLAREWRAFAGGGVMAAGEGEAYIAPEGEVAQELARMWAALLGVERVSAGANFFQLGGHSLVAVQLISRMRERLGVELPVRDLFERPVLADLARHVERTTKIHAVTLDPNLPRLQPVQRNGHLPLSFAQERLWFLYQLAPDSAAYNMPVALRLTGELDAGALKRALRGLIQRHESLRTTFATVQGRPVQIIAPDAPPALEVENLEDLPAEARAREAERLAQAEAQGSFDLEHGPLLRLRLLRLGAREHVLLATLHHIISDGWSMSVLARELTALYAAHREGREAELSELAVQYADYAVWQRGWLQGDALAEQVAYWRRQLGGSLPVLELKTDRPRPHTQSYRGAEETLELDEELTARLRSLSLENRATLFMTLLAAFNALLYRYTGQEDLLVGAPVANRNRPEIENLIGFFVNTLVLRTRLDGDGGFRQLLERVRETALEAYAHQDLPFEKLVEELHPERSLDRTPLFQVMFVLNNALTGAATAAEAELSLGGIRLEAATSKFDLRLAVGERRKTLNLLLGYSTDLFDAATVRRMLVHLHNLLRGIVARPEQSLATLPLLSDEERRQALAPRDGGIKDYASPRCLHELFEQQARSRPAAVALTFGEARLTYAELDERANRLANYLRSLGVGAEVRVGLCLERSTEMIVGVLGVLKAGGAYVPFETESPPERLAYLLEDSQISVLLTQESRAGDFRGRVGNVICLDTDWQAIARESEEPPAAVAVTPDNLAYVIYTSGSTGRAKGTMVTHGNVTRLFAATRDRFNFGERDVWTLFHSYAFDFSVWEIWGALLYGGRLVVVPYLVSRSPEEFHRLLSLEGVTVLNQTPSAFRQLVAVDERAGGNELSLRLIIFGGEALEFTSLKPWFARHGDERPQLVNMYGITETTVHVTYRPLTAADVEGHTGSRIGLPLPDLEVYVLDRKMQPVPVGVAGELYVGGAGLARCYLNRAELTAERFVPHPFSRRAGARLYKSGDLVRTLEEGDVEYFGRIDQQVKIRGFRIELGEIEAAIAGHPSVRENVVIAREDPAGDKRLVAYVVLDDAASPLNVDEWRAFLGDKLPEHMLPSAFVALDEMPLTINGKIDRRALPAPGQARPEMEREYVAPRNALERMLAEMWQEILGLEQIGVEDNFFGLGGDSIKGAVLINRLQERLGEIVHVVTIFKASTVADLAAYLVEQYPEAVSRLDTGETHAPAAADNTHPAASCVDAAKIARIRQLIKPLAPRVAHDGAREGARDGDKKGDKNRPAVFVLSPPRSGSTLLRVMLAGHPLLFAPPELELLSFNTLAERREAFSGSRSFWLEGTLRAIMEIKGGDADEARRMMEEFERRELSTKDFYAVMQDWLGERRLVDKTPSYALHRTILERAEEGFRQPFYIHLTRHPYGMIRSFEKARLEQIFFHYEHDFTRRELAELVWLVSQQNILQFLKDVPAERQLQVRFEELLARPREVMEDLCDALGLDFTEAMVQPYQDKARRMTDGIHAESRMLGDVKFHQHTGIDEGVASRWKAETGDDRLAAETLAVSHLLGYETGEQPQRIAPRPALTAIARAAALTGAPFPLSFAQQRLWFIDQLDSRNSAYNIPFAIRLRGALHFDALEHSLGEIVRRHSVLRTTFSNVDGQPVQLIEPPRPLSLPLTDLSDLPDDEREAEAERLTRAEAQGSFDLERGPLLRLRLLRLGEREHVLLATLHHIISDGWSMSVLARELTALYAAHREGREAELSELAVQYADYAVWQRGWLQGDALAEQVAYWRRQLGGSLPVLELKTDRPRPHTQSYRGAQEARALSAEVSEGLRELSRRLGATLFMTLLAAFNALLYRYTGQTDINIGTPYAGRNRAELEPLIGFFVNMLVLRTDLSDEPTFLTLLERVRQTTLEAYRHQDIPFEKLVDELQPVRDMSRSPLFQVMFTLQNLLQEEIKLEGLQVSFVETQTVTAKFDLSLTMVDGSEGLIALMVYNSDLFAAETIERMLEHYERLLSAVVRAPDTRLSRLPLLGQREQQLLLRDFNDTARPARPASYALLHELVAAQAARTPDRVAVVDARERLTYAELERLSEAMAGELRRRGVRAESIVGVMLGRGARMVATVLGVLKAGGAYLPLDAQYPAERLTLMLGDSGAGVLVTEGRLLERVPSEHAAEVVLAEEVWARREGAERATTTQSTEGGVSEGHGARHERAGSMTSGERAGSVVSEAGTGREVSEGNAAYVIYTSGSTGRPKGVVIEHRSAVEMAEWSGEVYGAEELRGVLAATSLSFDLSVYEMFAPLSRGGAVVVVESALEMGELAEEVTLINTVPSVMSELLRLGSVPPGVQTVNLAGEALPRNLVREIYERCNPARVWNLYGPTEDTTYSTFALITRDGDGAPSIGRPISNTQAYILDHALQPVPLGVAGELYLGGAGLARGYLNRPGLTAERFIPDPFGRQAGGRLYRTGDLARYLANGELEYLGRIDSQVKVRGFRIELGEIEAALGEYESIDAATVVVREDTPGDKRLVAYLVAGKNRAFGGGELRAFLKERLPDYMIPAAFVELDTLPLTPNGKIDRRALPAPVEARSGSADGYVSPRTPVEEMLASIWADVLKLERVGVEDNFFELGGHSLLATQVVSRVRTMFKTELSLRAFMERPTVAGLTEAVEASLEEVGKTTPPPLVPVSRDDGDLPLSFAQQRLWFLDRLQPGNTLYNMHAALKLKGALDVPAFERAFDEIVRRHESLRTTFVAVDGNPVQRVHPATPLDLPVVDLTGTAEAERDDEVARLAAAEARQFFDLGRGPLLRVKMLRLADDAHVVLVTMHHIISDGWSMGVMIRELAALYGAFSQDAPSPLTELPIQYADFAHWQREWLRGEVLERQIAYWRERLAGAPPLLELPTDRPRPALTTYRGAHEFFALDAEMSRRLKALGRQQGATLFMTVLAAFHVLLWRWSGQTDICVGTPIANRTREEEEGLIGFFVNTLVMRGRVSRAATFRQMLEDVREDALGAYMHQELPFEKLVEELQPERSLSYSPLFQVMLVLQNAPQEKLSLPGLSLSGVDSQASQAKFDLTLNLRETGGVDGGGIGGAFEYNADLFDAPTIRRMAGHLRTLLEGIVAEPERKLSELPLLAEAERRQLLEGWNDTARDYPGEACLHELFEAQAARTPDRVAVVFAGERLSYGELNCRANQLAHHLRAIGVGADSRVGICAERSVEMIVGLLGTLKAGGAYVPLDPAYPQPRLAFMLEDSGVRVLLTQRHLAELLPASDARVLVRLDADWPVIARGDGNDPARVARPDNLAYVIYTSGSTGRPKGVMISHRAICNHMLWMLPAFELTEDDLFLQKTPFSFDASVWEFYAPLLLGARLIVARPGGHQDPSYLLATIKEHSVTVLQAVPTLLNMLLETGDGLKECRSLKRVFCGGEALPVELRDGFFGGSESALYNLYGPTEATIDATSWQCAAVETTVPIGRPIANMRAYVLDEDQRLVPSGAAGELYLGGAGLARGYLNRPDLTAERFIPDPFGQQAGGRLYRTGDLARYLANGELEYLGRIDSQVKVRGFRIELGEIEAALGEHPDVREAVVLARAEQRGGERRLTAYVVARDGRTLSVAALGAHAKERLPDYMLPALYTTLDELPLLPNGKVDRRALESAADDKFERSQMFIAPRETLELELARIWEEVLGVRPVGVRDNFFEIGGHSLLAVRLVAQIQQKLGYDLPLAALFKAQTVEEIAMLLRVGQAEQGALLWSPLVAIQPRGERPPFFCVHPIGGNVLCYSSLARQLGSDQPFYGLQTPGLDGVTEPHTSVEGLAAAYVEALREVQPAGPYHLGGWSMGGLVAFEMAQQLSREGGEVASLTLLDAQLPADAAKRSAQADDGQLFDRFLRDFEQVLGVALAPDEQGLPQGEPEERARYILQQAAQSNCVPPDTGLSQMLGLYRVFKANLRAMMSYAPQVYAGGRVTLVRPLERPHDEQEELWRKLAAGGLELRETPGTHYTMLREPHVRQLAERLRESLPQT